MAPHEPGFLRTFVAIPIAPAVRASLAREIGRLARLDPSIDAVGEANLHVTIAFLGPTPESDVPRISEALAEAARGVPPIAVRYEGLGAFPTVASPRVVWAGVVEAESKGDLALLARRVADRVAALGFRLDSRAFHPHVTLARLREGRPEIPLRKALTSADLQDTNNAEVLSDLQLMVSEPGKGGPRYRPLSTARLVPGP